MTKPTRTAYVPAALDMTYDSQLIEGFLQTSDILVDDPARAPRPMDIFTNAGGQSEALVIQQGQVVQICREPLSDSGWNMVGLGAGVDYIAGIDSANAYAVDTGYGMWRNTLGKWTPVAPLPGGAQPEGISTTNDGSVLAVDDTGQLYQLDSSAGAWQLVPNVPSFIDPPVGSSVDSLWVTSEGGSSLSNLVDLKTSVAYPAPAGVTLGEVAVGLDGSVWASSATDSTLYQLLPDSQQFTSMAGPSGVVFTGLAVVQGGGSPTLWALDASNLLWCFADGAWQQVSEPFQSASYLPPTLSLGGDGTLWLSDSCGIAWKFFAGAWQRQMTPTGIAGLTTGMTATELATGTDAAGNTWAFMVASGALYCTMLNQEGWSLLQPVSTEAGGSAVEASGLAKNYVPGSPPSLLVSAVDSKGDLLIVMIANGAPQAQIHGAGGKLSGARPFVNPSSGTWYVFAVIDDQVRMAYGDQSNPLAHGFMEVKSNNGLSASFASIIEMPWQAGQKPYAFALDGSGFVWMIYGIDGAKGGFLQLSGATGQTLGVVAGTATFIDDDDLGWIFAIDASNMLWVIRQTNYDSDTSEWGFTSWHPLGDVCTYIGHGPSDLAASELFLLDGSSLLNQLTLDPTTQVWVDQPVLQPSNATLDPVYVAQYVTEVTVIDASTAYQGNPVPGVSVDVTACEPVAIWSAGQQYLVGPGTSVALVTDCRGKLTVSTVALGLHTPQLTLNAAGLSQPLAVYPPTNAQNRLVDIDGAGLQQAQSQTTPQFVGPPTPLVAASVPAKDAAGAAQAMQDTFTIKSSSNITGGTVSLGLDPTLPRAEALRHLRASRAVTARAAASVAPRLAGDPFGDFWNDLEAFAEDVYHAIAKGILTVESVTLDVDSGLLSVAVALEKVGSATLQFVIKTIHDVEGALVSAFQWVEATVQNAIDFLKELFDWQNVINTKMVVRHYISSMLENSLTTLQSPQLATWVDGKFAAFQATFDGHMEQVETSLEGNFSGKSSAVGSTTVSSPQQTSGVKCNHVHTHAQNYAQQGGALPAGTASGSLAGLSTAAASLLNPSLSSPSPGSFSDQLNSLQSGFLSLLSEPRELFGLAMAEIVTLFQDVIDFLLKVADDVAQEMIKLAADAVSALIAALTTKIDVPIISWIYQEISGSPLTLLDLMALFVALPATVVYALLNDGDAPFSAADVTAITTASLPWPQVPTAEGRPLVASTAVGGGYEVQLGLLYAVGMTTYSIFNMAGDVFDNVANSSPPGTPTDPVATLVTFASLGLTALTNMLSLPVPWSGTPTTAQQWDVAYWCVCLGPMMVELIFAALSGSEEVGDVQETLEPVLTVCGGLIAFSLAIVAGIEQFTQSEPTTDDILDGVQDIVGALPDAAKFLNLECMEEFQPEALAVLLVIDGVCDIANGALGYAQAIEAEGSG